MGDTLFWTRLEEILNFSQYDLVNPALNHPHRLHLGNTRLTSREQQARTQTWVSGRLHIDHFHLRLAILVVFRPFGTLAWPLGRTSNNVQERA
jgi:hypothetical protein